MILMTNDYDIIHFEALGQEGGCLDVETIKAIGENKLPIDYNYLITPLTLQEYVQKNLEIKLPNIISIKTHSVIPEDYLKNGDKKSIITRSAGYDHLENIINQANVTSLREYCVNAVAETAIQFLFSISRNANHYSQMAIKFDRKHCESFKELTGSRAVVYGVGKIGKRIYDMLDGIGIDTVGVDIREKELKVLYNYEIRFIPKENAIENADIIINAMNLTRDVNSLYYNSGYFSKEYLEKAKNGLIFVNVTRGEIAPESMLLQLYQEKKIYGLGLDVFSEESKLVELLNDKKENYNEDVLSAARLIELAFEGKNIYVSPHQAFNSDRAARKKARGSIKHLISWHKNKGKCFDEQLPYY